MQTFREACIAQWGETGKLRHNEPLARHGTFAVGGPAEIWFGAAAEADLLEIVRLASAHAAPVMFVGNGTNVLYADAGARGAVVRVSIETWDVQQSAAAPGMATLVVGAGVSLPKLVNELATLGWAGLEWGAGVPGTIGGAVVSNAGCHGQSVSDNLLTARVLSASDPSAPLLRELAATELGLHYRQSRFRAGRHVSFGSDGKPVPAPRVAIDPVEIITGATFQLRRDTPEAIKARVAYYKQHRKETQPPQPSAGSVFKNPPNDHAGRLVEAVGLKGHQLGGAAISAKHANFIVNLGKATAANIIDLIALAHATVLERFGIDLEMEVEPRGDW